MKEVRKSFDGRGPCMQVVVDLDKMPSGTEMEIPMGNRAVILTIPIQVRDSLLNLSEDEIARLGPDVCDMLTQVAERTLLRQLLASAMR